MADREQFDSPRAPEPVGPYPHARRVGNLLYLSGVGPRERGASKIPGVELDAQGNVVSYDIEAQCRSVFRNVRNILEDAGSGWDRIVDVTVFLTDMERDFAAYNRLYAEYFTDNRPCRTTVEVNALPTPIAIELKVIATVGGDGPHPGGRS
jgi:2-aminomuconate deaminase